MRFSICRNTSPKTTRCSASVPSNAAGSGKPQWGADRVSRLNRAHFPRRQIADGEDEIHDRRPRSRELLPILAVEFPGRQLQPLQQIDGDAVHASFGMAAGAESTV